MSTLTFEDANTILQTVNLPLRLLPKGFDHLKLQSHFLKAMQFCSSNAQAKKDVADMLSDVASDESMVAFVDENKPHLLANSSDREPPAAPLPDETFRAPHEDTLPIDQPQQTEARVFDGHHVYGAKFALYIKLDNTRRGGHPTIGIEGAPSIGSKKYAWSKKLVLQITKGDLPTAAAVFFGLLPECELQHYGADKSKRLTVKNQGKNFFINLSAKGFPQIAVPVYPADVFEIRAMFLQQLLANRPAIAIDGVLVNLNLHAAMLEQK